MKKQTGVNYLIQHLKNLGMDFQLNSINGIIEKSNEIERENIVTAYNHGTFYLRGEDYFKKHFENESGI